MRCKKRQEIVALTLVDEDSRADICDEKSCVLHLNLPKKQYQTKTNEIFEYDRINKKINIRAYTTI